MALLQLFDLFDIKSFDFLMALLQLFDLFDIKKNGVIEFEEFVRLLSIFLPDAPESDKIEFMFRLYDLRRTGYIEREELKEMVLALLSEMNVSLSDDAVEAILDKDASSCTNSGIRTLEDKHKCSLQGSEKDLAEKWS